MTVTNFTRSINRHAADVAYRDIKPDWVRRLEITPGKNDNLISIQPKKAGKDFHRLLNRDPLTNAERAYLPWLTELEKAIWGLGSWKMEAEVPLDPVGNMPGGVCDLFLHGGPREFGIIEVKVLRHGSHWKNLGRAHAQLGAYTRLAAGRGSFDQYFAGLAQVELETGVVLLSIFENPRPLILKTIELLRGTGQFSSPVNTLYPVELLTSCHGSRVAI